MAEGETIVGAVVFKNTGTDSTSELICFSDFVDFVTNGAQIDLTWPSDIIRAS